MHLGLMAAPVLVLVLASFAFFPAINSSKAANFSISNQINATAAYISLVNKSAYIIFYPNLSSAYYYLSKAKNLSTSDPAGAEAMLQKARASAAAQLYSMYKYRSKAVAVLVVTALVLAIALYMFAKPVKGKSQK
jgi:hypothetical protein